MIDFPHTRRTLKDLENDLRCSVWYVKTPSINIIKFKQYADGATVWASARSGFLIFRTYDLDWAAKQPILAFSQGFMSNHEQLKTCKRGFARFRSLYNTGHLITNLCMNVELDERFTIFIRFLLPPLWLVFNCSELYTLDCLY